MFNYVYAASDATCVAQGFLKILNDAIIFPLVILLTAIALLMFLYGSFRFVLGANESTARENGKKHMLYGIIGLLVMVSAFTILSIAANSFGLGPVFKSGNPDCDYKVDGVDKTPGLPTSPDRKEGAF